MKKRPAILVIFLSLILINLVSAYYGSYNSFSLSNLLNEIDASTMILGSIFIVSFAILNFALGRAFRGNKAIAGIISFVISLMIIWGINQTGFDYEGIFYSIGISESLLGTLAPIILLLGSILIILKFGLGILLMILGLFLVGLAFFTDKIYENGIATVIAIVLILIGAILWRKKKYREEGLTGPGGIKRGLGATGRTTGKIGKWGARQVGQLPGRTLKGTKWSKNYIDPRTRLSKKQASIARKQEKQAAAAELKGLKKHGMKWEEEKQRKKLEKIRNQLQKQFNKYAETLSRTAGNDHLQKTLTSRLSYILNQANKYGIELDLGRLHQAQKSVAKEEKKRSKEYVEAQAELNKRRKQEKEISKLQDKYATAIANYQNIMQKNNRKIPKKGTKDYSLWKKYLQEIKAAEKLLKNKE